MAEEREVKKYNIINGILVNNNTCVICMSCYHTAFLNNVLCNKPIDTGRKQIRTGVCPKCGAIIREEKIFKSKADKITEQVVKNAFTMETAELEARKKAQPFFMLMPDYPTLKYEGGTFFKEASVFDSKKVINDKEFNKFVEQFFQLRAFYKHIARKKFYYGNDAEALDIIKYQYCRKLQHEMIYTICKNKLFIKYWFMPYTKIMKHIKKYSKIEKVAFIKFVLALGKQVEDFEFLNYELAFGDFDSLSPADLERYNSLQAQSIYTSDTVAKWINNHESILTQFKAITVGADSVKEEAPVNDGQKSYQLTKELLVEYDKIIEAQRQLEMEQKANASDNAILKEIEEEADKEFKDNFIIDV